MPPSPSPPKQIIPSPPPSSRQFPIPPDSAVWSVSYRTRLRQQLVLLSLSRVAKAVLVELLVLSSRVPTRVPSLRKQFRLRVLIQRHKPLMLWLVSLLQGVL